MTGEYEGTPCQRSYVYNCQGVYHWNNYCGAYVCSECGHHRGLARCYCGWNLYNAPEDHGDPEEILRKWG